MAIDGEFSMDLAHAINKNGVDAAVGVPDQLLADFIIRAILALKDVNRETKEWRGLGPALGEV